MCAPVKGGDANLFTSFSLHSHVRLRIFSLPNDDNRKTGYLTSLGGVCVGEVTVFIDSST